MCSLIHVAHVVLCVLVLVGVGCVTVVIVHIGHDEVLVVEQFYVAIFVVIFCIRRCTLYTPDSANDWMRPGKLVQKPRPLSQLESCSLVRRRVLNKK